MFSLFGSNNMDKTILLFLVSFIFLESATALECYYCEDCQGNTTFWKHEKCEINRSHLPANHEYACLKMKFLDTISKKEVSRRQCAMIEVNKGNPEYTCPTNNGQKVDCSVCMSDLCNSAPNIHFNSLVASTIIVMTIINMLKVKYF